LPGDAEADGEDDDGGDCDDEHAAIAATTTSDVNAAAMTANFACIPIPPGRSVVIHYRTDVNTMPQTHVMN
jgi:hypothetical protein